MSPNEIARRLQHALNEYEGMRHRAAGGTASLEMAAHDFVTRIGGIITDIDADVSRERYAADERESMTPVAPHWPNVWTPVPESDHNSEDGE